MNQTAKITTYGPLDQWEYARFDVTVENDGAPSRFKIHGASKFSQYWKAFYYIGTTNITHAVEAGTYTTPSLAQGATLAITVKIDNGAHSFPGESGWTSNSLSTVLITSTSDTSRQDAVKIKLVAGSCGC